MHVLLANRPQRFGFPYIFTTRFTSLEPGGEDKEDKEAKEGDDKSLLDGEGLAMKFAGHCNTTQDEPIINKQVPVKDFFFAASVL